MENILTSQLADIFRADLLSNPIFWLIGALFFSQVLFSLTFRLLRRYFKSMESRLGISFLKRFKLPCRLLLLWIVLLLVYPSLGIPKSMELPLERFYGVSLILLLSWLSFAIVYTTKDLILSRYDIQASDNLKARAVYTQVNVLIRIAVVVIGVIAFAAIMMMFDSIRSLGTSLLASAGVVGIIIGLAAQKSIGALLAGLQVAVTQPIRIDDVVIVDGEWGWVEEITLTYVVIRIWDLRRLIVPVAHFLEKSFQNWTRISADLLGSVYLYADYTLPVPMVREELHRILQQSSCWDGKVWRLHVTNMTEKTVELRALMSARDSSAAWELRCEVREKLLDYLQQHHGQCLPKSREEVTATIVPAMGKES